MALTSASIKTKLAAAPSLQRDNTAQDIINGASISDLRNLDSQGVLMLYEALAQPIETHLLSVGKNDDVAYVNEVVV